MKNSKTLKYIMFTAVGIILIGLFGKKAGWFGGEDEKKVSVEKVSRNSIVQTVSASGKVQPEKEVKISPDVSGEIVELYIKEGEPVKAGQLLARINQNIYSSIAERTEAALNTSRANLATSSARVLSAESQLARAKADFDRNEKLFKDGAISASEFDASKSGYEVAKADAEAARQDVKAADFNVKSAAASLKESRDNLQKTSIVSPVNGTVSKLSVEKGERVVGTSQMAGTEMMRIANLNEMEVTVDVNENDIIRVHLNDTALIEVDSYMDRKFKGIVTEIGSSANVTGASADQVTNFTVKVRILRASYQMLIPADRPDYSPFKPGMTANVDIQTQRATNVLSVPVQSVTTRDTMSKVEKRVKKVQTGAKEEDTRAKRLVSKPIECVFVVKDGKVEQRVVTTAIQDANYIQILSGLKEGEEVVSGPYSAISKKLKKDDKVKVVPKEELFEQEEE